MEYIFITARFKNDLFDSMLAQSLEKLKAKCVNVFDRDGDSVLSISKKYNIGIDVIKNKELVNNNTVVVFVKNNVSIIDGCIMDKIDYLFSNKINVGVVGVVGIKTINNNVKLYDNTNTPLNSIIYADSNNISKKEHFKYSNNGFYDNVVAIDDSIIAMRGGMIIDNDFRFDLDTMFGFGIEATVKAIQYGYDTVCADMMVATNDDTNISFSYIDDVVSKLNLTYPVSYDTIKTNNNFIIDVVL